MVFKSILKLTGSGIFIVSTSLLFSSCTKEPGDGGTSTITGHVTVDAYNASGILYSEYSAPAENIYIIYGDGTIYDDNTKTSYDGNYKFTFLRKGTYKIFAYSDCLTCDGLTEAKFAEVEIKDNNSDVTAPEILIDKR